MKPPASSSCILVCLVLLLPMLAVLPARAGCTDYSRPLHWIAELPTGSQARDVDLEGSLAAVANGAAGLLLVDLFHPAAPVVLGSLDLPGVAVAVELAGDHAYVALNDAGLAVVDVSDPTVPVLASQTTLPGPAVDIAVAGHVVLVAEYSAGLGVIDVSDPDTPVTRGTVPVPDRADGVAAWGDFAYVACNTGGIAVVDFGSGPAPVYIGAASYPGHLGCIDVDDGLLVTGGFDRSVVLALLVTPTTIAWRSETDVPYEVRELAIDGTRVMVADSAGDLQILDVTDVDAPVPLTPPAPLPGSAYGLAVADGLVCLSSLPGGLEILSGHVDETVEVTPFADGESAVEVAVREDAGGATAFVAGYSSRLWAYDLATHDVLDVLGTPGKVEDVDASGADDVLVADGQAGLLVVAAGDPSTLQVRGSLVVPGYAMGVARHGTLACVAASSGGLHTVDVTDPTTPELLGSVSLPGYARRIVVTGDVAWVAAWEEGLHAVDITDPAAPALLGTLDTDGSVRDLVAANGLLYVADGEGGMLVVDGSDPTAPVVVGAVDVPGNVWDVTVIGDVAYLAHGDENDALLTQGGVFACDLTVPDDPVPVGSATVGHQVRALAAWTEGLCAATSPTGPLTLPLHCSQSVGVEPGDGDTGPASRIPARTALREVYPNPFNPRTTVVFACRRPGPVEVAVHDLTGRRVALLLRATLAAGEHRVAWDGRDDTGRPVATGIYLVRLRTVDGTDARKILLAR